MQEDLLDAATPTAQGICPVDQRIPDSISCRSSTASRQCRKMESGTFRIDAGSRFAPRAALVSCCNLLALKARENGIDLVTRAPDDLPDMTGDPRAFRQIVLNLVANAIKFTERGGEPSRRLRGRRRACWCCAWPTPASASRPRI